MTKTGSGFLLHLGDVSQESSPLPPSLRNFVICHPLKLSLQTSSLEKGRRALLVIDRTHRLYDLQPFLSYLKETFLNTSERFHANLFIYHVNNLSQA